MTSHSLPSTPTTLFRKSFQRFAAYVLRPAVSACVVLSATAPSMGQESSGDQERPPNIVFINVDDLGWADLGCQGSEYYETPTIDRLAAEGMRFTDAYAAAAICSPTRAAMLTGRYPARLGMTDWLRAEYQGGEIPLDRKNPVGFERTADRALETPINALWLELEETTFAELLQTRGYATGHVGKWHLGFADWSPERQGFDVNVGGGDLGEPPSFFDPFHRPAKESWNEPALLGIPKMPSRLEGEYLTDREADEAVDFIRANRDRPFILNLWHYAVHQPIAAKPSMTGHFEGKAPVGGQKNAVYAAMILSVDQALAQILAVLDELELSSRTLVVFTSDNGGLNSVTSNAPLRGGKGSPYEGGLRVPLIVRWPGHITPGSVCSEPVTSIDFLPTFAEAAGVPLPSDLKIDGDSLLPVLTGTEAQLDRSGIFWHFPHYRGADGTPYSIIRRGDWKLIERYGEKPDELFNLADDESETTNLATAHPGELTDLRGDLHQWLEDVEARVPRPVTPLATPPLPSAP